MITDIMQHIEKFVADDMKAFVVSESNIQQLSGRTNRGKLRVAMPQNADVVDITVTTRSDREVVIEMETLTYWSSIGNSDLPDGWQIKSSGRLYYLSPTITRYMTFDRIFTDLCDYFDRIYAGGERIADVIDHFGRLLHSRYGMKLREPMKVAMDDKTTLVCNQLYRADAQGIPHTVTVRIQVNLLLHSFTVKVGCTMQVSRPENTEDIVLANKRFPEGVQLMSDGKIMFASYQVAYESCQGVIDNIGQMVITSVDQLRRKVVQVDTVLDGLEYSDG